MSDHKSFDRPPAGRGGEYEDRKQRFAYSRACRSLGFSTSLMWTGGRRSSLAYIAGPTLGELMRRDMANADAYLASPPGC
jgi:hypothetical protein